MGFAEEYEELIMSEKEMFQKIVRVLLKQTFIVCDRNEESRKMYFFAKKHQAVFDDYFKYMGFEVVADADNKVFMIRNQKNEVLQSNRLRFRKYESIVLCCLWTLYVDQIREGNLARPIKITVFDLRQCLEKYGIKEEMEGKGALKDALDLFSKYQLLNVTGEVGSPECEIRLFASLQFALDTEEFKKLVEQADQRMKEKKKTEDIFDETDEGEDDEP